MPIPLFRNIYILAPFIIFYYFHCCYEIGYTNDDIFCNSQSSFRDSHKHVWNRIHTLQSIIQTFVSANSKLWCVFVDYEKAFAMDIRDALWVKLEEACHICQIISMIIIYI